MKMKKYSGALLNAICCALILCSCSAGETSAPAQTESTASEAQSTASEAQSTASEAQSAASEEQNAIDDGNMNADFTNGESPLFEKSNGWTNGGMFNCTWRDSNVTFENGAMQLSINADLDPDTYSGAEYRSKGFYGYGMYEVSMKPIKNDGVVSSFFTYTGPSDNNPWDEIDIEFLGKDTTIVQFNYFTDGVGNHEKIYDLGFDATEDFHTYGFKWAKDSITWYVDGEAVYTAEESIPVTESKIMMNTWNGVGVDEWLNEYDGKTPLTAEYQWVKFTKE